jgi:hypothetical protein
MEKFSALMIYFSFDGTLIDFRVFLAIFLRFFGNNEKFHHILNWLSQKYRRILNISTSYLFDIKKWLHLYHDLLEINKLAKKFEKQICF